MLEYYFIALGAIIGWAAHRCADSLKIELQESRQVLLDIKNLIKENVRR